MLPSLVPTTNAMVKKAFGWVEALFVAMGSTKILASLNQISHKYSDHLYSFFFFYFFYNLFPQVVDVISPNSIQLVTNCTVVGHFYRIAVTQHIWLISFCLN